MYNKHSLKATEFIDDEEIKETLRFAQENKRNKELISSLIERAKDCKGLTHREAAVLYSSLVITIREYYKFSQFSLITEIGRAHV